MESGVPRNKYMKKLLLILLFLFSMAKSEDVSATIDRLGDDDFNIRESATDALSNYSLGFIDFFLDTSNTFKEKDPETAYRLGLIAKSIFYRHEFESNEDIKRLRANLDIELTDFYVDTQEEGIKNVFNGQWQKGLLCKFADCFGTCKDKLQAWDIIICVDGEPYLKHPDYENHDFCFNMKSLFKVGTEYELTIIRFTETEKIDARTYPIIDTDPHKVMKVKVTPIAQKDIRLLDMDKINDILNTCWIKYLSDYNEKPVLPKK